MANEKLCEAQLEVCHRRKGPIVLTTECRQGNPLFTFELFYLEKIKGFPPKAEMISLHPLFCYQRQQKRGCREIILHLTPKASGDDVYVAEGDVELRAAKRRAPRAKRAEGTPKPQAPPPSTSPYSRAGARAASAEGASRSARRVAVRLRTRTSPQATCPAERSERPRVCCRQNSRRRVDERGSRSERNERRERGPRRRRSERSERRRREGERSEPVPVPERGASRANFDDNRSAVDARETGPLWPPKTPVYHKIRPPVNSGQNEK